MRQNGPIYSNMKTRKVVIDAKHPTRGFSKNPIIGEAEIVVSDTQVLKLWDTAYGISVEDGNGNKIPITESTYDGVISSIDDDVPIATTNYIKFAIRSDAAKTMISFTELIGSDIVVSNESNADLLHVGNGPFSIEVDSNTTISITGDIITCVYDIPDAKIISIKEMNNLKEIRRTAKKNDPTDIMQQLETIEEFSIEGSNNISNMVWMFGNCKSLVRIPVLNTSDAIDMSNMFDGCISLTTIPLLDTSKTPTTEFMFNGCTSLTSLPILNTSEVQVMKNMFDGCISLTTIPLLDTSKVTNMEWMFYGCISLTTIPELNTSNVTNMGFMFSGCKVLTTVPKLDTSKITTMESMFNGCTKLTVIPLLNTSKVTNMNSMFNECTSLTAIAQSMITSNVINMNDMFNGCTSLTNIYSLDVSKVTDINGMLDGCAKLVTAKLQNLKVALNASVVALLSIESVEYILNNIQDVNAIPQTIIFNANAPGYKALTITSPSLVNALSKGWAVLPEVTKEEIIEEV